MTFQSRCGLVLCLVVALGSIGCLTSTEVRRIVDESNAELAALTVLDDVPSGIAPPDGVPAAGGDAATTAAVERIDAFILRHGENARLQKTIAALQVRKALLLDAAGRDHLALATIDRIDRSQLGSARDIAIVGAAPALFWWTGAAQNKDVGQGFADAARRHLRTLDQTIAGAPTRSGIRYYLVNTRAHIELKASRIGVADHRAPLQEAIGRYCDAYDESARAGVRAWVERDAAELSQVPLDQVRWLGHADITFCAYWRAYRGFLEEVSSADPATLDPVLRDARADGSLEEEPRWPDQCTWLVELRPPDGVARCAP